MKTRGKERSGCWAGAIKGGSTRGIIPVQNSVFATSALRASLQNSAVGQAWSLFSCCSFHGIVSLYSQAACSLTNSEPKYHQITSDLQKLQQGVFQAKEKPRWFAITFL
uniref:Uncharacterized protein n=1 Tax=Sphaerodactylus townsendi TaxID=933632 RepID=A0ACB8E5N0_9SAUR